MFDCNVGSPKGKHRNTSIILITSILPNSCSKKRQDHWGSLLLKQATLHCLSLWLCGAQPVIEASTSRVFSYVYVHTHSDTERFKILHLSRGANHWGISSNHNETSHRTPNCNRKNERPGVPSWMKWYLVVSCCVYVVCVCMCVCARMFLLFCLRRVIKCHAWANHRLIMSRKICLQCFIVNQASIFYILTNVLEQNE